MSGNTPRWVRLAAQIRADVPLALLDALLVASSFVVLLFVRLNGDLPALSAYSERLVAFVPVIVVVHLAANRAWGLYGEIWRHASVAEARRVMLAGLTAGSVIFLLNPMAPFRMPRSVALVQAFGATGLMGLARFQARLFGCRRQVDQSAIRVAVVGAGDAGAAMVREMQRRPDNGRVPVVVVDDDGRKQGRALLGVPVEGHVGRLDAVVRQHRAQEVLVAIPRATQELLGVIMEGAHRAGVPLKTLPPLRDLSGAGPTVGDARGLEIEDLLGRTQVPIDTARIRAVLAGGTVLITGAGGSIGAEIARQVAACRPARLLLLDHDETHLHDAAAALVGTEGELSLVDIRDRDRMVDIFVEAQPDLVFHAAAHKHVPLLEAHPWEAVLTNILGTRNIVDAAAKASVPRLVFISTDKAVRPSNTLGYSKWLGEQLLHRTMPPGSRWCSVRFGNVLGSRGSVIPTFARQIAEGGPVTVTDPRMTRFFMSVPEAVQLVLQASVMSEGGEIFMLDMGDPVNILAMAQRMVRLSGHRLGHDIPVQLTGCRPGEKLAEGLQNPEEEAHATDHPAIVRLKPVPMHGVLLEDGVWALEELVEHRRDAEVADTLAQLVEAGRRGIAVEAASRSEAMAELTGAAGAVGAAVAEGGPWNRSTT